MRHALLLLTLLPALAWAQSGSPASPGALPHPGQVYPSPVGPVIVVHGSPVSPVAAGVLNALLGVPPPTAAQVYAPYGYGPAYAAPVEPPLPPPRAYPTDTRGDFKD